MISSALNWLTIFDTVGLTVENQQHRFVAKDEFNIVNNFS